MFASLLYVSRSSLALPREVGEVDAIVSASRGRNAALGVTGALVFTERHFGQYLEGPEEALDELMSSIARDRRHSDVDVVFRQTGAEPRFTTWAMAYAGPSTFVAGNLLPLTDPLPPPARRKAAERLINLMRQFVEATQQEEQRRNRSNA